MAEQRRSGLDEDYFKDIDRMAVHLENDHIDWLEFFLQTIGTENTMAYLDWLHENSVL